MDARIQTIMAHVRDFAEARHRQGHSTYNIETAAAEAVVVTALDAMLAAHDARVADLEAGGVERLRSPAGPDREALTDLIAEQLRGTYHCNRVWEAWFVGTMSQRDFEPVYDSDTPGEIADAIIAKLDADRAARAQASAEVEPVASNYSLDTDTHGIRALTCDAIMGAITLGAQNTNPAPEGHWLAPFWQMANAQQAAVEPVATIEELRSALKFYADKNHFILSDQDAWDTVSGEPQNWWCDEAGTATVEDGSVAAMALRGTPFKEEEDEEATPAEPAPVTDAMVDAYLEAQRRAVEEADRFGRPNIGGLHTDTVREACRQGLMAAIGAAADPARRMCE